MIKLGSSGEIEKWLIEQLSSSLKVPKNDLDPDAPLTRYGLDSMDSVTLVMELEDQLGVELPPTLFWEYPTIRKCVLYLARKLKAPAPGHIDTGTMAS